MSILNEPSVDFHLKLNEQSFHIPNELLKKNIRSVNKLLDRDSKRLHILFGELDQLLAGQDDKGSLSKLNEIIKTVEILEKKLEKRIHTEAELLRRIQYRIDYYNELNDLKEANDRNGLINWYQRYTNLLVGDYLTRNGMLYDEELDAVVENTGEHDFGVGRSKRRLSSPKLDEPCLNPGVQFLKQQGLEHFLDYDILLTANRISKSLTLKHTLGPLIHWIKENSSYLTSKSSMLEFEARLQEYIELVKIQDYPNAITCFQSYLVKFIDSNFEQLKLASGLLVFIKSCSNNQQTNSAKDGAQSLSDSSLKLKSRSGFFQYFFHKQAPLSSEAVKIPNIDDFKVRHFSNNMDFERYTNILDGTRWDVLKDLFLQEYFSMYGISHHDPLLIYLSLGISTLKTKACLHESPVVESENIELNQYLNNEVTNNKCPVCSDEFATIARGLPYAHHIQSNLFENPVMLPNGNIYDSKKLKILAHNLTNKKLCVLDEDEVLDPIDRKIYSENDFITMYPT
ncbi:LAFE_0E11100g1_1 [Lachancea fermentati]|uniref:LAFE_0E11100g1_1 n=1 Tax=Lachancea fermentati TaxID=4955 RepID=A0A1G4MDJ4_LACFM|nr:LAFE_0E11100g1_1 [Lachancea fermentati]